MQWSEVRPWMPWLVTGASVAYVLYIQCKVGRKRDDNQPINPYIDKHEPKVKHVFNANHIDKRKKLSLCRCWRSETFPYCDGAHKEYNEKYKDNVGPVNIEWGDESEESKTLGEPDIQSMNASTELSSLEMIDSNGSGDNGGHSSSHSNDDNNHF